MGKDSWAPINLQVATGAWQGLGLWEAKGC